MQAYTRLTAQRRFSFRTKHHELNTRLYGQVFSRILDQWPSRCSTETVYEAIWLYFVVPRCRASFAPGGPKDRAVSQICQIRSPLLFKIFLTWRPAEVNSLL